MSFLDRLERKHPRWGIEDLMKYITVATAVAYIVQFILGYNIVSVMTFNREAIFTGELWRIITFIFIPPTPSMLFIIIALYFYYFLGTALENVWGSFRFTIYYALCMLGTIVVGLVFGGHYTGYYVNLSLFLAFAFLYPENEVRLFFFIPIKIKYLAYFEIALLTFYFITGGITTKLSIIASLTGFLIFFSKDFYHKIKMWFRRQKYKNKFK